MSIQYIDPENRWSEATLFNNILYYTSVPENLEGDILQQTTSALQAIDNILTRVGSNKSNILDATIFLADKADFAGMNQVWDSWVVPGKAPVRCTVQAILMNPKYKIEIKIVAAIADQ
ncbi:RidA family protein [Arsenophonus apicola]|uniref:RidA family protein n=1 Tax=Arsenophonus apicola TaxID=2879119 RepID=A0ABY8P5W9_9GAMM|nr:RidA family protein [Arsenophonus apicola]WGO84886.1 RidA family protein [Arsenophonus apicola]